MTHGYEIVDTHGYEVVEAPVVYTSQTRVENTQ